MKKNFLRTSSDIKEKVYILNEKVDGSIHASRFKTFFKVTPVWMVLLLLITIMCLLTLCIALPIVMA